MKCLVTGSAGFIGKHLATKLLRDGHQVAAVDKEGGRTNLATDSHLRDFTEGTEVVFHLAAATGLHRTVEEYIEDNFLATGKLLEACKGVKLKRFVLASTSSVYGANNGDGLEDRPAAPASWYGATKLASEQICRVYQEAEGLPLTIMRLFSVYGPYQRPDMGIRKFIDSAIRGEYLEVYGNGLQVRSYSYVDDVVDALLMAPSIPEDLYNVSGDQAVSVRDLVKSLERVTGKDLATFYLPPRQGEQRWAVGNCSKLKAFGWRPKVELEEGLRRQYEWQKNLPTR